MSDPNTPSSVPPPSVPPVSPAPTMAYAMPGTTSNGLPVGYIEPDPNMRSMAMLAHLLGFVGGFIGPLILYLIKKDDPTTNAYLRDQMTEALNWHLTLLIAIFASVILMFVLIGFLLMPALAITNVVFIIINAIKANKGEVARYPWRIKFI